MHRGAAATVPEALCCAGLGEAHEDHWTVYERREEDNKATPGRSDMDPARSQSRGHASLVHRLSARLVYAVALLGYTLSVLFNLDITRSVRLSSAEFHISLAEPALSYFYKARVRFDRSSHLT